MNVFSARDAAKRFGEVLEACDDGPVTINRNGRARAVVLSARDFEDYETAMKKYREERCLDLVVKSLDLLKDGRLGKGDRALALAKRLRLHEERSGDAGKAAKLLDGPST